MRFAPSSYPLSGDTRQLLEEFCDARGIKKSRFPDYLLFKVLGHLVSGKYTIDQVCGEGTQLDMRVSNIYFNSAPRTGDEDWTTLIQKPAQENTPATEG